MGLAIGSQFEQSQGAWSLIGLRPGGGLGKYALRKKQTDGYEDDGTTPGTV